MILRRLATALLAAFALAAAGCGFHLRKEANLPPSIDRKSVV